MAKSTQITSKSLKKLPENIRVILNRVRNQNAEFTEDSDHLLSLLEILSQVDVENSGKLVRSRVNEARTVINDLREKVLKKEAKMAKKRNRRKKKSAPKPSDQITEAVAQISQGLGLLIGALVELKVIADPHGEVDTGIEVHTNRKTEKRKGSRKKKASPVGQPTDLNEAAKGVKDKEIKSLLADLEKARDKDDKTAQRKIRRQLRAKGFSLRNGK